MALFTNVPLAFIFPFFIVTRGDVAENKHMLLPFPKQAHLGTNRIVIPGNFHIASSGNPTGRLQRAADRYTKLILDRHVANDEVHEGTTFPVLDVLHVEVGDVDAELNKGVDESYAIDIVTAYAGKARGVVKAHTWVGALRGMETFSQLVNFDQSTELYYIATAPVHIVDEPAYSHRGILIDTARHWLSPRVLREILDQMSYAKFNVMHWHLLDKQSFSIESKAYPRLTMGAFSPFEKYTQKDIRGVVEYARDRGIRVIPEFDVPGHTKSWGVGMPELFPQDGCDDKSALDPTNEKVYKVIESLLNEYIGPIFTDKYVHMGGDEVAMECWGSSTSVAQAAKDKGLNPLFLFRYFVDRIRKMVQSRGKEVIFWDEVFENGEPNSTIVINHWLAWKHITPAQIVQNGHRVILDPQGPWYLDTLESTWEKMYKYDFDPMKEMTAAQRKLVLGGEAAMWGEKADPSDLASTIWPRAAAVAENLWTARIDNNMHHRMLMFRCHLLWRGVGAAPVDLMGRAAPKEAGSCSGATGEGFDKDVISEETSEALGMALPPPRVVTSPSSAASSAKQPNPARQQQPEGSSWFSILLMLLVLTSVVLYTIPGAAPIMLKLLQGDWSAIKDFKVPGVTRTGADVYGPVDQKVDMKEFAGYGGADVY